PGIQTELCDPGLPGGCRARFRQCLGGTPAPFHVALDLHVCPIRRTGPSTKTLATGYDHGRQFHGGAEPASVPPGAGESSVMGLRDALDDRQAEADTCVVAAYALAAA